MFMNVAYLNNSTSTVVDNTKPLIVTSCGNYRVKNRSEVVTHRPKGRKDYQLLYIASGKGHFFIHGEEKTVSAGNIIVYLPDQPQEYVYYRADQTDVYWVHFTGNEVEEILKYYNINLQNNILYIGTSPCNDAISWYALTVSGTAFSAVNDVLQKQAAKISAFIFFPISFSSLNEYYYAFIIYQNQEKSNSVEHKNGVVRCFNTALSSIATQQNNATYDDKSKMYSTRRTAKAYYRMMRMTT